MEIVLNGSLPYSAELFIIALLTAKYLNRLCGAQWAGMVDCESVLAYTEPDEKSASCVSVYLL